MVELLIVLILAGTGGNTNTKILVPELFDTHEQCRQARAEIMKEFVGQNVIMSCRYKN